MESQAQVNASAMTSIIPRLAVHATSRRPIELSSTPRVTQTSATPVATSMSHPHSQSEN
jgi:hypothetical protein